MVFNGHTTQYIDTIDEELFAEIQVMFADGMLGNKAIFHALTPLTTGIFNYMRGANSPAFRSDQIFPWIDEYSIDPEIDELKKQNEASESLKIFMTQAPGFNKDNFSGSHSN